MGHTMLQRNQLSPVFYHYRPIYQGSLHNSNEEDSIELVEIQEAKMPTADNEQVKEGTDVNQPDYSEDLTANEIKEGNDIEYSDLSIAEAIGLEGFEIIYKSFETHDIYPEEIGRASCRERV